MISTYDWNYLRVRGEYQTETGKRLWGEELPPRARRIRRHQYLACAQSRTTSACAENTRLSFLWDYEGENYLRVRGEYGEPRAFENRAKELPPRARRILAVMICAASTGGTTSACAENTS